MKNIRLMILASGLLGTGIAHATVIISNDDITVALSASSAPNGSAASDGYARYLEAMRLGATGTGFRNVGDRSLDPGAFEPITTPTVDLTEAFVTNYASWRGVASPSAPFANEHGNRIQFNMIAIATGPGVTLSLSGVTFGLTSEAAPWISNAYAGIGGYANAVYSTRNVGVTSFGADGKLGGGDDTYLMGGESGSTPVLALILRGNGFAYDGTWDFNGAEWDGSFTDAGKYAAYRADLAAAYPLGVDLNTSYTLNYAGGAGTLTANATRLTVLPEPGTYALAGASLAALAAGIRRRCRLMRK